MTEQPHRNRVDVSFFLCQMEATAPTLSSVMLRFGATMSAKHQRLSTAPNTEQVPPSHSRRKELGPAPAFVFNVYAHLLQSSPLFATLWSPPGSCVHEDSPGKNTGVGSHAFLQRIFPTQELNPGLLCLLHCRQILYPLSLLERTEGNLLGFDIAGAVTLSWPHSGLELRPKTLSLATAMS